ncbi:MAG: hypothetical protein WCK49_03090 [Myxococcaceae bacterium]
MSLSLHADDNATCLPYVAEGVAIARNISNNADNFVQNDVPAMIQSINNFSNKLDDLNNLIRSIMNLGSIAIVGVVSAASITGMVLAVIAGWKLAGGTVDKIQDKFIGKVIQQYRASIVAPALASDST